MSDNDLIIRPYSQRMMDILHEEAIEDERIRTGHKMITEWKRTQPEPGVTLYSLGRYTVRKVAWRKPGFKNIDCQGWALHKDGKQDGPAHRTAKAAMAMVARQVEASEDDFKRDGQRIAVDGRLGTVLANYPHFRAGAVYVKWDGYSVTIGYPTRHAVELERACLAD